MKAVLLSLLVMLSTSMIGQSTCEKSVSFAVVQGGQIISAVPPFATNWMNKHYKKYPDVCFSQIPYNHAKNFVIVFSNSASSYWGLVPTVRTDTSTSPVYGSGTVTDNYGGTWNYTYNGTITTTTTTAQNVPYTDISNTLYANAYDQNGIIISSRWATRTARQGGDPYNTLGYNLGSMLASIHLKEHLLESTIKDIHKH